MHPSAISDPLTGLPNRTLMLDRIERSIARRARQEDYLFAVLFMDIDRFRVINDGLGREVGDELLAGIGQRLQSCLRRADTIARLGGDEFAIILEDIKRLGDAIHTLERIQKELLLPFHLDGREIFTSASVGIVLGAKGYNQPEELLRDAEMAMYRARTKGPSQYDVFETSMHEEIRKQLQLEADLRRAIHSQELYLQYQPVVFFEPSRIVAFEALIRWAHPERGIVCPAEFLPTAEETGLMTPISQWVLQEACRQLAEWQAQFLGHPSLSISVNVNAKYLARQELLQELRSLASQNGISLSSLILEITENQLLKNAETTLKTLLSVSEAGIKVWIDDFGTGFSSLSYLANFPVHSLKIDQSFVANMTACDKNLAIVRAIVSLGQNLGITVIGEGIETSEQLACLRSVGCQYGQGYYFAKPMDKETAAWFLERMCHHDEPNPTERLASPKNACSWVRLKKLFGR